MPALIFPAPGYVAVASSSILSTATWCSSASLGAVGKLKYRQTLVFNGRSISQGLLIPSLGKISSVTKLKAVDTRVYNTNTSLPMVNKAIFGKKSTRVYTTATTRTVTNDIVIPITGRSGSTADTVSWYINDQDVLTVIPQGSALVTLYFARTIYSIGSTINLFNSVIGYSRKIDVLSKTDGSITFTDPGDLPSTSAMYMIIATSRDIIDYSTVTYLDNSTKIFDVPGPYKLSRINTLKADNSRIPTVGKTKSITRLIGKTTIGTSGNLQKPVAILRADSSYSSKVYAGTDTTQVFYDTTIEPVIRATTSARSGASNTNNLVDWLDDETDILVITNSTPATPLLTLYIGSNSIVDPLPVIQIRMETVSAGASLTTTASIVSFTSNSITIVDPGEIPSPIDTRVWLHWTKARSVITTTLTSNDTNKISLVNKATFSSRIPRAYTTSTIQTILVDTAISVTGSSGSTADTVSWYINDQDILTVIPQGSALVTLYFAKQPRLYFVEGGSVKLFNYVNGYSRQITVISSTDGSITFADPGDIPSTSGLQLVYTETQTVFRSVTNSILENNIEIVDTPKSGNLSKSSINLRTDAAKLQTIPGKVMSAITVRSDNNQRSGAYNTATQIPLVTKAIFGKKYTRAYTTSTLNLVTTDIQIPVISRTGSTADTVSWYINDQDILTIIPQGSALITLYFARPADNVVINISSIKLINTNIGYSTQISIISKTENSVTFVDPGDLPSISNMFIIGTTSQYVVNYSTVAYLDDSTEIFYTPASGNASFKSTRQLFAETTRIQSPGKTNNISKLIAGTRIPPSANLQKQFAILKADNNQRTTTYSTVTQIPLVTKAIFGKRSTRAYTTATTRTVTSDILIPVTGISGSTADTVSWYINDQDILTVIPLGSALVTLYFAKLSYAITGTVRITNTNIGYSKLVSVISSTDGSITFTDPEDLPSISSMYIVSSMTQSIIDYQTYAYLDSGTQMFDVPRVSKLSTITKLKSDLARVQTVGKTAFINRLMGKTAPGTSGNLQKQISIIKGDNNQRTATYSTTRQISVVNKVTFGGRIPRAYTTSTTSVIYVDTPWPITGRSGSTADTVNWYIYDQDILNTSQSQEATVTLYFAQQNLQTLYPGLQIRLLNWTIGYTRLVTLTEATNSSITFVDPGDLPSISGLSILLSVPQTVVDNTTITQFESGNELVNTPKSGNLSKSSIVLKADSTATKLSGLFNKPKVKLISGPSLITSPGKVKSAIVLKPDTNQRSSLYTTATGTALVNKAIFGKRVPQAYTSATIRTVYTDIQLAVTGISGSTADTVSWYINDQDILTVISVGTPLVTLYFVRSAYSPSAGSTVSIVNINNGYSKQISIVSSTDGSITFADPGDLPSISGMYIVVTQSQNIIDYITISNLDYNTSIFSIPTVNSLIKSKIQIRSPRAISAAYTLTNAANRLESTVNTTTFVYTQTSVTTTLAPTTARERLYYAQIAPGRYGVILTYNGSSIAPGGILSTATNRLESTVNTTTFVYTQTSVTTTLAPTNARERLYYAQLAAGKYGVTLTYNGSSIAPGGILSTATNRLESTVNTTTFVYTQTSVITTLAPTTARERLYYAQLAAGRYGVTLTYNGRFLSSGPNVPATDALQQRTRDNRFYGIAPIEVNRNLEFFSDTNLIGEISFPVRYQLTNVLTTSNSIAAYIYDYDILTYSTYRDSPPTRTFLLSYNSLTLPSSTSTNANYIPFAVGSTIKISSKKSKYVNTFTVIQSNYSSVTISDNPSIPTLPDTDDVTISNLPSVYPIALVSTNTAPITARENLYYFNLSPGLRSDKNLTVGEVSRISSAAKLKSSLVVKALPNNLSASVTSRVPIKLKSDTIRLTANKVTQTTARLQADRSTIRTSNLELIYFVDYFSSSTVTTSTFVVPTTSVQTNLRPQTPREVLFYAQMGPGIRNGGITLTAFGKQIGDANAKLAISTINKNISPLKADSTKITVGKTSIPSMLVGRPSVALSGNLQKTLQVLKADSSYPTKSYTATDTTSTFYDNYVIPITGISRNLSTADTVAWYINDQDILTIIPVATDLITLYFIPSSDSIVGAELRLYQPSTGYSRIINSFSYTNSSITFIDPLDLPDIFGMTINWSRSRTVISTTVTSQDNNKTALVTKAIFGKKLPQARVSSVTSTINVDVPIAITAINRPGSTADTVNWYINDSDILTTSEITGNLVTLFFDRQNLQIFSVGDVIRLADYSINYIKQVTLVSATPISVTFVDPGDLVSSSINLRIIVGSTQTVTDFQTTTYLDNSTEIFDTPKISSLDRRLTRNLEQFRAEPSAFNTVGRVKVPLKLISTSQAFTTAKLLTFAILKADRNNLTTSNLSTRKTAFAKLTDDVSIKLVLGRGQIIKLYTGNFKPGSVGIQDPAAQKKEPIQFWN